MPNERITALILAAGKGKRLFPLTKDIPKPLVEIKNKPIIIRALSNLEKLGIKKYVIIIGYKASLVKKAINEAFAKRLNITYISNPYFETTNNIYSLWLARDYLASGDCLLLESDVIFDRKILNLIDFNSTQSLWLVDNFKKDMNGALLIADKKGKIKEIKIIKDRLKKYQPNYYKSIGILRIKQDLGRRFCVWLESEIKRGNKNIYYDLVLSRHLKSANLFIRHIKGFKWWEIDNREDLQYAKNLFSQVNSKP